MRALIALAVTAAVLLSALLLAPALVYPYFEQVDALPEGDVFYGLDFGYSIDYSALIANVIKGDCLYSRELIYEKGLTNDAIAWRFDELGLKRLAGNAKRLGHGSAETAILEEIQSYLSKYGNF